MVETFLASSVGLLKVDLVNYISCNYASTKAQQGVVLWEHIQVFLLLRNQEVACSVDSCGGKLLLTSSAHTLRNIRKLTTISMGIYTSLSNCIF